VTEKKHRTTHAQSKGAEIEARADRFLRAHGAADLTRHALGETATQSRGTRTERRRKAFAARYADETTSGKSGATSRSVVGGVDSLRELAADHFRRSLGRAWADVDDSPLRWVLEHPEQELHKATMAGEHKAVRGDSWRGALAYRLDTFGIDFRTAPFRPAKWKGRVRRLTRKGPVEVRLRGGLESSDYFLTPRDLAAVVILLGVVPEPDADKETLAEAFAREEKSAEKALERWGRLGAIRGRPKT
jgi:hypothetical protein